MRISIRKISLLSKLMLGALLIMVAPTLMAKDINHFNRIWLNVGTKGHASETYGIDYALSNSFRHDFDNHHYFQQDVVGFGLSKSLTSRITAGLGVGYWVNKTATTLQHERRSFEQLQVKWLDGLLKTRFRLEQRYRHSSPGVIDWFRVKVAVKLPKIRHDVTPYIDDEPFWLLNRETWLQEKGLDQNRFQIGLKFKQTASTFSMGYMNHMFQRDPRNTMAHNIIIGYSF